MILFTMCYTVSVLRDFIEIAFEYLTNKIKQKSYANAACKYILFII